MSMISVLMNGFCPIVICFEGSEPATQQLACHGAGSFLCPNYSEHSNHLLFALSVSC